MKGSNRLALLLSALSACSALNQPSSATAFTRSISSASTQQNLPSFILQAQLTDSFHQDGNEDPQSVESSNNSRRSFLVNNLAIQGSLLAASSTLFSSSANAASSDIKGPIVVLGANGKTGTECVKALTSLSVPVRATSRSGVYKDEESLTSKQFYETAVCDVTQSSTVSSALKGASAVIFAASASKHGGTPAQVDNDGLLNVAKACIQAKIPKLVIVSSGAVTQPSSPVFLFLNLFGKIMEEKIKGEDAVRSLYASLPSSGDEAPLSYTIIRPGGLTEEEGLGVLALELNQGDTKSGRIARADVAQLCIQSIFLPSLTENSTFECYDKDTGAPLATVGASNIMKSKTKSETFISGRECIGNSWEEIFKGLERD